MEAKSRVFNVALTNRLSLSNKISRRLREFGCQILAIDVLSPRARVRIDAPSKAMLQGYGVLRRRCTDGSYAVELLMDEVTVQWLEREA